MTTTYSTDTDVRGPCGSVLADEALRAVNAARATRSLDATTLDAYRVEAQRQILIALRLRGILDVDITRPADLLAPEVALTIALLCESLLQHVPTGRAPNATADTYAQGAAYWREKHDKLIAAASPIDGQRGAGRSFRWDRC